jgi:hypothetical protein
MGVASICWGMGPLAVSMAAITSRPRRFMAAIRQQHYRAHELAFWPSVDLVPPAIHIAEFSALYGES